MGFLERLKELDTATLVGLALVVGVVGLILLVVLTVVVAAIVGTFVLGVGEEVETTVQAGASVVPDEAADEVQVVWTSNQNAEVLIVEWQTEGGSVTGVESGGTVDGNSARLGDVGTGVTLAVQDGTTVEVTVTAVAGDDGTPRSTVVVHDEVTV